MLSGIASGFTAQAWDIDYIFKGLRIGQENCPQTAGLITYARGPLENNRCVGNLAWRISAYRGDWREPVLRYRDWCWQAYGLETAAQLRPDWVDDLRLAVSWCPTNLDLLDALARRVTPSQVFLHLPNWRPYRLGL